MFALDWLLGSSSTVSSCACGPDHGAANIVVEVVSGGKEDAKTVGPIAGGRADRFQTTSGVVWMIPSDAPLDGSACSASDTVENRRTSEACGGSASSASGPNSDKTSSGPA